LILLLAILCDGKMAVPAWAESASDAKITFEVTPRQGHVGDALEATLTLELPPGFRLDAPPVGPELGPFTVLSGGWLGPAQAASGAIGWTWKGRVAAYETGVLELPSLSLPIVGPAGSSLLETKPVEITIQTVLPPEVEGEKPAELSGLKAPASIPADYGPLRKAFGILALLLALSGLAWWLHRRYASRLDAVPAPVDPFRRMPPHVWVYEELQRLLDRRLAEEGQVDLFFSEISRILKQYLGGRYRVDLVDRTTEETVPELMKAGAPADALRLGRAMLERSDRVKFARDIPDLAACRASVEEAYRIVDATRPVEVAPKNLERGAA